MLVAAKCTQCGAIIKVDSTKETGVCENCGMVFVTENAVNNYTSNFVTNNMFNTTQYITKTVVGREKTEGEDYLYQGDTFFKLEKFAQAREKYQYAIDSAPHNYKGWLGVYRIDSKDFKDIYFSFENLENALKVANEEEKDEIYQQIKTMVEKIQEAYKKELEFFEPERFVVISEETRIRAEVLETRLKKLKAALHGKKQEQQMLEEQMKKLGMFSFQAKREIKEKLDNCVLEVANAEKVYAECVSMMPSPLKNPSKEFEKDIEETRKRLSRLQYEFASIESEIMQQQKMLGYISGVREPLRFREAKTRLLERQLASTKLKKELNTLSLNIKVKEEAYLKRKNNRKLLKFRLELLKKYYPQINICE